MNNAIVNEKETIEYEESNGYNLVSPGSATDDEVEKSPVVNQDNEVVNDQGYNHDHVITNATEVDPLEKPEPGGDSAPPEISIDPQLPAVEQPIMAL